MIFAGVLAQGKQAQQWFRFHFCTATLVFTTVNPYTTERS